MPGVTDGCVWEREDVDAVIDLVSIHSSTVRNRLNYYHVCHSSNSPASLTARLGATIDVEQNHVRFLGDLILNLWDCGGQDAFMDTYLALHQSTMFQHVGVMIYVFEVESRNMAKDLQYYRDCLAALQKYSPTAAVFLLVHKMDLARGSRAQTLMRKTQELQHASGDVYVTVFGTSIYDESLYKVLLIVLRCHSR